MSAKTEVLKIYPAAFAVRLVHGSLTGWVVYTSPPRDHSRGLCGGVTAAQAWARSLDHIKAIAARRGKGA